MQKWNRATAQLLAVAVILTGCATKTVSPEMRGISGVTYGTDREGYPTLEQIAFTRPTTITNQIAETCIVRGVEQPLSSPTVSAGVWQVTAAGAMYWEGGGVSSVPFRYTLSLAPSGGTSYVFTRMVYANAGVASANPLLASKWWSPQHAYSAMRDIVDRIDACLLQGQ